MIGKFVLNIKSSFLETIIVGVSSILYNNSKLILNQNARLQIILCFGRDTNVDELYVGKMFYDSEKLKTSCQ